jgi:hypothetical protein
MRTLQSIAPVMDVPTTDAPGQSAFKAGLAPSLEKAFDLVSLLFVLPRIVILQFL